MSSLGSDFDEILREADVVSEPLSTGRRSPSADEYVAAVSTRVSRSGSAMAVAVAYEYAKEMMAEVAEGAYERR